MLTSEVDDNQNLLSAIWTTNTWLTLTNKTHRLSQTILTTFTNSNTLKTSHKHDWPKSQNTKNKLSIWNSQTRHSQSQSPNSVCLNNNKLLTHKCRYHSTSKELPTLEKPMLCSSMSLFLALYRSPHRLKPPNPL